MSNAINGTPTPLQERVAQLCDPYQGEEGANAVRMLANEVGRVEQGLADARHRIRTLIEERDSARIQADHKWKLREEFEALLGTNDVAVGAANVQHMKRNADRYEVVRKMNATQFSELLQRCLFQDLRFDNEVDRLAAIKTVKMHLKVKEDAR